MSEISELLKSLEKGIQVMEKGPEQTEALIRLEDILSTYSGEDRVVSTTELIDEIKNELPTENLYCGLVGLDDILGGFRRTQLVVLSGITKHGKTSFAVDLTIRMQEQGQKSLWLPFEEPAKDILRKFIERDQEPPVFYTPKVMRENTLVWIEKKIIEARVKHDISVVFIDHLFFIEKVKGSGSSDNLSYELGNTVRAIKQMAVKWGVVIVLLTHLKKTRLDTNPDLEDVGFSAGISQEADTVLLMWRETKREGGEIVITNNVNLSVQANRRTGKTGNVKLVFDNGRFLEEDWRFTVEESAVIKKFKSW